MPTVDGRSPEQLEHDQHHDDKPIDRCSHWDCIDYVKARTMRLGKQIIEENRGALDRLADQHSDKAPE